MFLQQIGQGFWRNRKKYEKSGITDFPRETAGSGGDQFGANLRVENYSVNSLNQYTQRTVPGKVDILGAASASGTVTMNYQPAYRKGEYFRTELSADNSVNPVYLSITNIGALKDGANPDITSTNIGNVLLAKAVEAFTHDADGNLTSDSLWTNNWNGENRLITVESASGVPSGGKAKETWSHLPDGLWRERIVAYWNGSAYTNAYTNRFVWDKQVLLAVLNHTNGVVTGLMRGLDLSGSHQGAGGVGGVLAVTVATNGVHFTSYDGNGNVSALVGATGGTATANYDYSPFGVLLRSEGVVAKANPIRWSTQFADDVTGRKKYLYRDLTDSGRWLSRDPMEERGGHNLYGFVQNDPGFWFDALGLAPEGIFMITAVNVNVPSRGGNVPGFQVRYVPVKGNCSCPKDKIVLVQVISHDSNAVGGKDPHFDGTDADNDNNRKQGIPPPPYPATGSGKGDGGPLSYKDAPYSDWYTDYSYSIEVCAICRQSGKDAMLGCARFTWTNKSHKLDPSGAQEATNPSSLWNDALKKWTDAQPK